MAIDYIDKSIDYLQKTKDALLGTDRNLRLADDKPEVVATAWGLFGKHAAYSPQPADQPARPVCHSAT